jgi:hypothetical protein
MLKIECFITSPFYFQVNGEKKTAVCSVPASALSSMFIITDSEDQLVDNGQALSLGLKAFKRLVACRTSCTMSLLSETKSGHVVSLNLSATT